MRISYWSADVCSSDLLEGEPQEQDAGARHVHPAFGHQLDDPAGNVAAHPVVEAAAGQNHLGVIADGFGLVRQIVRVDADAVADDQTGAELEAVPLGASGPTDHPGFDAEPDEATGTAWG